MSAHKTSLATQSATELARRIRSREVTSLDVVNAHIAVIEAMLLIAAVWLIIAALRA